MHFPLGLCVPGIGRVKSSDKQLRGKLSENQVKCLVLLKWLQFEIIINSHAYTYLQYVHLLAASRSRSYHWKEGFHAWWALLPSMSDEGVVHPSVAGYRGSSQIIFGELNLYYF